MDKFLPKLNQDQTARMVKNLRLVRPNATILLKGQSTNMTLWWSEREWPPQAPIFECLVSYY